MKPVKLEIEGLYSYREKQTLDFRPFYPWRLFGIFGRTGDGKSSILDAITFALYGKLDRLGRNLREAINPTRDALSVNFVFEIDEKIYKVKRTFRRSGQGSVTLYEQTEEQWHPLGEKAREVEKKLSKILGLNFEEFTKVVLLPQGKFAEFLRLPPAQRAQMLEGLFGLEIFGDTLFRRVSEHARSQSARLEDKKKALKKLEGVSATKIKLLKKQLDEILNEIRREELQKEKLENRRQKLELLESLLKKRELLKQEKQKLETKEEKIEQEKKLIQIARKLSPTKIIYEEFQKTLGEKQAQREKITKLKIEIERAKEALGRAEQRNRQRILEIENRQSELIKKETIINKNIDELKEISKKKQEVESIAQKIEEENKKLKILEEKLEVLRKAAEQTEKKFREISSKAQKLSLTDEETKIEKNIEDIHRCLAILEEKEKALQEWQRNKKRILAEIRELETRIKREGSKIFLEEAIPPVEELVFELKKREETLTQQKTEIQQLLERIRTQEAAWILAQNLEEGKPCPVCGSREHPAPATQIEDHQKNELEKELRTLEGKISEIQRVVYQLLPLIEKRKEKIARAEEACREIEKSKTDIDNLKRFLEEYGTPEDIKKKIRDINRKKGELEKLKLEQERASKEAENTLKEIHALEKEKIHILSNLENLKQKKAEKEQEIKTREEKIRKEIGKDLFASLDELKRERTALQKEKEEIQQGLEKEKQRLKDLELKIEGETKLFERNRERLKELQAELEKVAQKEGFSDIKELEKFFLPEEKIKEIEERIKSWKKALDEIQGSLKQIEDQIKDLPYQEVPPGEPQKTVSALENLREKIASLRDTETNLKALISQEEKALEEKKALEEEIKELEKEVLLAEKLYQCLRGRALVTFAARYLFQDILYEANRLLKALLGDRFLLKLHRESFSFSVYDLRFGHERPVETLSGGETFIVSFALALALSSYIQKTRVRPIHFFFVDEGFGSLDQELLEAVTEILYRLREQDRLVGIITHLERFKEIFPSYVMVEKDETGASRIRLKGSSLS